MLDLLTFVLVLAGLAGTVALIVRVQQRSLTGRNESPKAPVLAVAEPAPAAPAEPPPPAAEPPLIAPPTVDRTAELVAERQGKRDEAAAREAETRQRLELLESARESAEAQARASAERADAMERQAALLAADADRLTVEAELLGMEVDVLGRRKDVAAEAASRPPGFAVLPYKGPTGTWRRPIAVECVNGGAHLPPGGPTFSLVELTALQGPGTPFLSSIVRLSALLQVRGAPDGAEVTPYVLFVVRPDGIRPFYEARGRVEEVGLPYGYELVGQDEAIEFPAIDDPTIWGEIAQIRERGLAQLREGSAQPSLSEAIAAAERGGSAVEADFPPAPPTAGGITTPRSLEELIASDPGLLEAFAGGGPSGPLPHDGELRGTRSGGAGEFAGGESGPGMRAGATASPTSIQPDPRGEGSGRAPDLSGTAGSGPRPDTGGTPVPLSSGTPGPGRSPNTGGRPVPEPGTQASSGGSGDGGGSLLGGMPGDEALELTVVCTRKGAIVHPGAYRLTTEMLKRQPDRLTQALRSVVTARETATPGRRVWPSVKFLIERDGEETYWSARRKVALDLPEWPTDWHVAEARTFSPFGTERW